MNDYPIVIIGGGLAGCNVAHEFALLGLESLIVEAGTIGEGSDRLGMLSGTGAPAIPKHSKLVTRIPDSTYAEITQTHGSQVARTLMDFAHDGVEMMKANARSYDPSLVRELGCIEVTYRDQADSLAQEECYFRSFGHDVQSLDSLQLKKAIETNAFHTGLLYRSDALLDIQGFLRSMSVQDKPLVQTAQRTLVTGISEKEAGVILRTENAGTISADHAIVATNAFTQDLGSLITPHWSFIQCYEDEGPNLPGVFTYSDRSFYFTRQDGILMAGGADAPAHRMRGKYVIDETGPLDELSAWITDTLPHLDETQPVATHYGIFAMTQDGLPIVGTRDHGSRIAYIVGCNAIGCTFFPLSAHLLPGMLGYRALDTREQEYARLISPERLSLRW